MLVLLEKIAEGLSKRQPYTLTGAADWAMVMVLGGVVAILFGWLLSLIIWHVKDLKSYMKESDTGMRILLDKEEIERKHQDDLIWEETRFMKQDVKECKAKCQG